MEAFKVDVPNQLVGVPLDTLEGVHSIFVGNDGLAEARYSPERGVFVVRMSDSINGDFWEGGFVLAIRNNLFARQITDFFLYIRDKSSPLKYIDERPPAVGGANTPPYSS